MFQNAVLLILDEIILGILLVEFLSQDDAYERDNIAYFSQVWNEFINSMREEDLIGNRFNSNCFFFPNISCFIFPKFSSI